MRAGVQRGVVGLGLIDQFGVIAEIHVAQFGMTIQTHRFPDKGIELPDKKVGQVKGGEFVLCFFGKNRVTFKKRITMRAFDHLDAQFLALIEQ